jgi:hypothetical protein
MPIGPASAKILLCYTFRLMGSASKRSSTLRGVWRFDARDEIMNSLSSETGLGTILVDGAWILKGMGFVGWS